MRDSAKDVAEAAIAHALHRIPIVTRFVRDGVGPNQAFGAAGRWHPGCCLG